MTSKTQLAAQRARRIQVLGRLLDDGQGRNVDAHTRSRLTKIVDGGSEEIRIRTAFLKADEPLPEASDRKRPDREGWPPVSILSSISKGVALPMALTALLLAQTGNRTIYAGKKLRIPARAIEKHDIGWTDVLAISTSYRQRVTQGHVTAEDNRRKSIVNALDRLDIDPQMTRSGGIGARVALLEADRPAPGARRAPTPVTLLQDAGFHSGPVRPWTLPEDNYVNVPLTFWTNGWVHALTPSETANFLMYLQLGRGQSTAAEAEARKVTGALRAERFGLSTDVWETHKTLSSFGLMDVEQDPERRDNGQMPDGRADHGHLHAIKVLIKGLEQPAVTTVIDALNRENA